MITMFVIALVNVGDVQKIPKVYFVLTYRNDLRLYCTFELKTFILQRTGSQQLSSRTLRDQLIPLCLLKLTPSTPAVPNCYCSKGSGPYWSNPLFLIFNMQALWRSVLSSVCISDPDIRYPDLSVNFMAAKNPDILK